MIKSTLILNKLILELLKNNTLLPYYQICILQELVSKKIPEKFSKKIRVRARGEIKSYSLLGRLIILYAIKEVAQ